jgi:hypothetical protein
MSFFVFIKLVYFIYLINIQVQKLTDLKILLSLNATDECLKVKSVELFQYACDDIASLRFELYQIQFINASNTLNVSLCFDYLCLSVTHL